MKNLVLVMVGGAVGSGLRYGVAVGMSAISTIFPTATLLVNIVGSFLLGCLAGSIGTPLQLEESTQLLLGTGICGGFTTYSAFAVESVRLTESQQYLPAAAYVASTLLLCSLASWGGLVLIRSISRT